MSDSTHPIRSYQRIFKPDRRVYAIDGRRLPVPGGVPLEWLGWAFCSLIVVLVAKPALDLLRGSDRGGRGAARRKLPRLARRGPRRRSLGSPETLLAGVVLDWLDWPLRLLIVPGMIATLAGQASPDGRPAHRYLTSLAGASDARGSPLAGLARSAPRSEAQLWAPKVWVAPDRALPGASPRPGARPRSARVRTPGRRDPRPAAPHRPPR